MLRKQNFKQKNHWANEANERGGLLAFALILAVIFSILSMSVLFSAVSQAKQSRILRLRTQVRYIAEQYLVQAQGKLQSDPSYAGETIGASIDGNPVDIIINANNPCTAPCNNRHIVTARVTY